MTQTQVLIIGIGNVILRDEGVGVHAVWRLKEQQLPPGVEVIDGGTATMDLLAPIRKAQRIIVIDAVKGGGTPGQIYRVRPDDLSRSQEPNTRSPCTRQASSTSWVWRDSWGVRRTW